VVIDDVVRVRDFFQGLGPCDYNFSGAEYAGRDLLHVLGRLELDFHGRVPVGLERDAKNAVCRKMFGDFEQVYLVIETKICVYHDDSETV
jgi:hypothetical protein